MAREIYKENKCYMRVWADKSNIFIHFILFYFNTGKLTSAVAVFQ